MKNIHIVLVSAGYGSQDLTNLLEGQKFKSTKELKDAIINKIGEPNELDEEQILIYQLNEFTQAVNDQVLDNLSNDFIFAVEIAPLDK
jgi:hypothetical protein